MVPPPTPLTSLSPPAVPPPSTTVPAVELRGVIRTYGRGASAVHALRDVDLALPRGTFTAVMGASGSGKSTLLQLAAGLDAPTSGTVVLGGTVLDKLSENDRTELRRGSVGFVFQAFNLLPALTVLDNVLLPVRLAGRRRDRRRGAAALAQVGLAGHEGRRPSQLSGGQQQRVAIARALVTDPEVIFADEPTGALDPDTARDILRLLRHAVDHLGATVVMVTHDPLAASFADRVVYLADGRLVSDELAAAA
jgi:putative ABC transport system ATP-binding protein